MDDGNLRSAGPVRSLAMFRLVWSGAKCNSVRSLSMVNKASGALRQACSSLDHTREERDQLEKGQSATQSGPWQWWTRHPTRSGPWQW